MQSTGHTSTQASSFAPMHGSQITYVKRLAPYLLVGVPVGVNLREVLPLLRQVVFGKDRLHGTGRLASATVYTLVRVDVEQFCRFELRLVLARVDAVHRANIHAGRV